MGKVKNIDVFETLSNVESKQELAPERMSFHVGLMEFEQFHSVFKISTFQEFRSNWFFVVPFWNSSNISSNGPYEFYHFKYPFIDSPFGLR